MFDELRSLISEMPQNLVRYLTAIKPDKMILWCYLIWYLTIVYFYFDPSLKIWLNAMGISAVIGTALMLSVSSPADGKRDHWQTFRLYMMPFCVSSFSTLIKGRGFLIIISPNLLENTVGVLLCSLFLLIVFGAKIVQRTQPIC